MLGNRPTTFALCLVLGAVGGAEGLEAQLLHDPRFDNGIGERWAVVIGISEYEDPGITDLEFAHRDAEAFAQFLRTPLAGLGGFRDDHIRLLTNQDASANQIRTALFDFLARPAPDDVVYFFFAGHGMPQPGRPNGTQFLVPSDGDHTNLAGSAVRMADVESAVFNTQAQVVLFIDACHAGAVSTPGGTRGDDLNRINSQFIERIAAARPSGVSMVVAAHEGEYAHEGTEWGGGHGVFTYHLIQALGGRGDRDEDGIVDLGEVYDYVRARVPQDTDNQQTPFANDQFLRRELPMAIVADSATLAAAEAERERLGYNDRDSTSLDVFVTTDLTQQEWFAPDSIVAFVGVPDTLEVLLGSPTGRRAPPTRLRWTSSNPAVASVDGFGTVRPESPGVAEITASVFTKDAKILVRVLPTPTSIVFSPPEGPVEVSQFDELRFAATVELPNGETVAGVLPTITIPDTSVVAPNGNGQFTARREGRARVDATLGSRSVTWEIDVRPPRLNIDRGPYGAMRFTDTIPLLASFVRDDGSRITEASGVTWQSSDTTVLRATASGLVAVDVGRAVIRASVSSSRDSVEIFVLGDIIVASAADGGHRISTVDLGTKRTEVIADGDFGDRAPRLSPDGRRVAFVSTRDSDRPRVHVMDADGGEIRRLTPEQGGILGLPGGLYQEHNPAWSADGERVFFVANYSGNYEIYSIGADGSDLEKVTSSGSQERSVSVSAEGGRIAFERVDGANSSDVWVSLPDGAEEAVLTGGEWSESRPVLLAEGRLLIVETPLSYRAGEALALYDGVAGTKVRTLVQARKDHRIIFAASPAGDYVAFSQVPRLGGGDPLVTIVGLDGVVVDSFTLPDSDHIIDLSWGAVALRAEEGEGR